MNDKNWYSVLNLDPSATTEAVAAAVEKMSRQAAAMANTSPERSQRMREDVRAMKRDLLSSVEQRAGYDATRQRAADQHAPRPPGWDSQAQAPALPQASPSPYTQGIGRPAAPPVLAQAVPPTRARRFRQFLQSGWTCPACGEGAMPSDKFCQRCGTPIPGPNLTGRESRPSRTCVNCSQPVSGDVRFCSGCGASQEN